MQLIKTKEIFTKKSSLLRVRSCVNVERPLCSLFKQKKSVQRAHENWKARFSNSFNTPYKNEESFIHRGTQSNPRPSKAKKYIVVIEVR